MSVVSQLHNIQEVLLNYRVHNSQVSQKRVDQQTKNAKEIKFSLLSNLDFHSSVEEQNLLHKIFIKTDDFTFEELKQFQSLKSKLESANEINFFDKNGFNKYLSNLNYIICKKYFFQRKNYSPIIYYRYIKFKGKTPLKLTAYNQLILFVKSLIFYKIK